MAVGAAAAPEPVSAAVMVALVPPVRAKMACCSADGSVGLLGMTPGDKWG